MDISKIKTIQNENPATFGQFEIINDKGRLIRLDDLTQWRTYSGMLCGYPGKPINEGIIERNAERAGKCMCPKYPLTLLPPAITAYDYPPAGRPRLYPCEALPPIFSVAIWTSFPTSRDEGCNSSAMIAWYQAQWGIPDEGIVSQIKALDWDVIAQDWDW